MSFNRHIKRNFNANKTHRIRYDKDDFTCRIYKYDKTSEVQYLPTKENFAHNGKKYNFQGYTAIKRDDKNLEVTLTYNTTQANQTYRAELLYANTYKKNTKVNSKLQTSIKVYLNGKLETNQAQYKGNDVQFNRHYHRLKLKKGKNTIKYVLSPNTIFVGALVRRYDWWVATRHNNDNDDLTMIKATVEHTNEFKINTMTAEFMYHHKLDELLEPTNANANRSGLVFDYRDEITLYVTDTNGKSQTVFGGYISTAEVDDDLTKMTLECADRLIDLDRRYCLSEIELKDNPIDENMDYTGNVDYLKDFNYWSDSIKFLLDSCEVPFRNNIKLGSSLITRKTKKLATYGKDKYNKITSSNMNVTYAQNGVVLRNGDDTLKGQNAVIFDAKDGGYLLNDYPNLFIDYGLGEHKWEEKIEETQTVEVEKALTKKQSTWLARANSITSATGDDAMKPIWQYCYSNIQYKYKRDFYQSAETTWKKKSGNCCCKTEVMLNLLYAKGVTDLKYVHCKVGNRGHIFGKVNGMYLDPTTRKGYGDYVKGYGGIVKVTDYPTKPF